MNAYLQALMDSPIECAERANKLFLPEGRKAAKRGPKAEYYAGVSAPKVSRSEIDKRKSDAASAKLVAVLDYYATTTVPFERVAEHTKLTLEEATAAMLRRGRSA